MGHNCTTVLTCMKMPLVTLKQRQKEYSITFDIWLIIYRVPCFRLQYGTTFDWGWLTAICIVVVTDRMINCLYLRQILRKKLWFNLITKMYLIIEFWKPKSISLDFRSSKNNYKHDRNNKTICSYSCSGPDEFFNPNLFR